MLKPMPSPNGTNIERLFILRGRGAPNNPVAAYDAAPGREPPRRARDTARRCRRMIGGPRLAYDEGAPDPLAGAGAGDGQLERSRADRDMGAAAILTPADLDELVAAITRERNMSLDAHRRHAMDSRRPQRGMSADATRASTKCSRTPLASRLCKRIDTMAKQSLKLIDVRDPSREALAAAIADETTARKNLEDARSAASKAEEQVWSASARLMALREEAALASPGGAIISSLAAGNTDVAELDRPQASTRAKIETAEQELAAWRRARDAAEQEIAPREEALDWAQRHVRDAVSEVMRTADIDVLLEAAEQTQARLLAERCSLMEICEALPIFSPERKAVESFLGRPFLLHENGDEWKEHAAVAPWRAAFDALHHDAETPLPAIAAEPTVVVLSSNGRE